MYLLFFAPNLYLIWQKVQEVLCIETVPSHVVGPLPIVLELHLHRQTSIIPFDGQAILRYVFHFQPVDKSGDCGTNDSLIALNDPGHQDQVLRLL